MNIVNIAEALEKLGEKYGTVKSGGHTYYLTQQAYTDCAADDEPYYQALAVRDDASPDKYGYVATYSVIWYVPQSTLDYWEKASSNGDYIDEGDACNWDNPDEINPCGNEYKLA